MPQHQINWDGSQHNRDEVTDATRLPFHTDLFASHPRSFAYYLDPMGFEAAGQYRRPNVRTFKKLLPNTYALAEKMLAQVLMRDRWGKQLDSADWVTESFETSYPCGKGRFRPGQRLGIPHLIKHLINDYHTFEDFAVGTLDIPHGSIAIDENDELVTRYNKVSCLRIDVDQDHAWLYENSNAILTELFHERQLAHALGLPYRAFRTGNRGFQAVLPLPLQCPHGIASFVLGCYRSLLEARKSYGTNVDVDNLHKLVRLPGGMHPKTSKLALWIDLENGRLYPLEDQSDLMHLGFSYPKRREPNLWEPKEFLSTATEILNYLDERGLPWQTILTREQITDVLSALPRNLLVQRVRHAQQSAVATLSTLVSLSEPLAKTFLKSDRTTSVQALENTIGSLSTTSPAQPVVRREEGPVSVPFSPQNYTAEWAAQVLAKRFSPGGFWTWINMGGQKAILAATIHYGKERAEQELLRIAAEVPARSDVDREDRARTIRTLWKSFGMKDFTAYDPRKVSRPLVSAEPSVEVVELAQRIVNQMMARQPKHRWSVPVTYRVVETLLIALQLSDSGTVSISYRTLAASINVRWPSEPTNHMRVKEVLQRLISGDSCLYAMLRATQQRTWKGEPTLYAVGKELRETPLGQACEERRQAFRVAQDQAADAEFLEYWKKSAAAMDGVENAKKKKKT